MHLWAEHAHRDFQIIQWIDHYSFCLYGVDCGGTFRYGSYHRIQNDRTAILFLIAVGLGKVTG